MRQFYFKIWNKEENLESQIQFSIHPRENERERESETERKKYGEKERRIEGETERKRDIEI